MKVAPSSEVAIIATIVSGTFGIHAATRSFELHASTREERSKRNRIVAQLLPRHDATHAVLTAEDDRLVVGPGTITTGEQVSP